MLKIQYKHYIRVDENSFIIKGFSDLFEAPLEEDICIDEDGNPHFELFGVVNPTLLNMDSFPKYKYIQGEIIESTEQDYDVWVLKQPSPEPTVTDVMAIQITQLMISNAEKDEQLQMLASQVTELMLNGGI